MRFFSTCLRRTERLGRQYPLFRWRFSVMIACSLSLVLISLLGPTLPVLAKTHSHQGQHPINVQALRQQLKRSIRVTHTGHAYKAPASSKQKPADASPVYNNVAISDDQNPSSGNFDAQGSSYSAQALQIRLDGRTYYHNKQHHIYLAQRSQWDGG